MLLHLFFTVRKTIVLTAITIAITQGISHKKTGTYTTAHCNETISSYNAAETIVNPGINCVPIALTIKMTTQLSIQPTWHIRPPLRLLHHGIYP